MTSDAVVRGARQPSFGQTEPATGVAVTREAFRAKVCGSRRGVRLFVRRVACETPQPAPACLKAAADAHRLVMFQQVRRFRALRQLGNCDRTNQRCTGPKAAVFPSRQQSAGLSTLVAQHTNIFSQAGRKVGWIHNRGIGNRAPCATFPFLNVKLPGAVTVFAANSPGSAKASARYMPSRPGTGCARPA